MKNNLIEMLPVDTGNLKSGVIYAANETRFDSTHLSEPLTMFSTGIIDREKPDELLNRMSSRIVVPRRFEYHKTDSKEDFLSETDDVRAIGAEFKRVAVRGEVVNAATQNKGLTMRLDKDGEGGLPGATERATGMLTRRLYRNDFRRLWALLIGGATITNKTWNTSVDPDVDLDQLVDGSGDLRGIDPNVLVFGRSAISKRIASLSGSEVAGAMVKLAWTMSQLGEWLGLDDIVVPKARYQVSLTAKQKIVGSYALAYYYDREAGLDSPTNSARFVTPTVSGGDTAVYIEDRPKFIDVTVEQYSLLALPSALGIKGYLIQ